MKTALGRQGGQASGSPIFSLPLPQFVFFVLRPGDFHEEDGGEEEEDEAEDEGGVEPGDVCDDAAEEDGDADADVPRDEVGGVRGAPAGGFRKVDEQGLVGRRHHPVAQPEGYGGAEEHGLGGDEEEQERRGHDQLMRGAITPPPAA